MSRSLAPILNSRTPAKDAAAQREANARRAAEQSREGASDASPDFLVGSEPPC